MSRVQRILLTAIATTCITQAVFRLSGFKYGQRSLFSQPFDLVNFTVKMLWWFGAWLFFFWLFGRFVRIRREK